jgi:outer membrane protein TolC
MSFRDDHDAALARAEALENELEQERARGIEAQKELDVARAVRQRLERELAIATGRPPKPEPEAPSEPFVHRSDGDASDHYITGMVALLIALFLIVLAISHAAP